jgi:hypothetical protein
LLCIPFFRLGPDRQFPDKEGFDPTTLSSLFDKKQLHHCTVCDNDVIGIYYNSQKEKRRTSIM